MFGAGCNRLDKPSLDWSVNLKREGKAPYDTRIASQSARFYFPDAEVKPIYSDFDFSVIDNNINGNTQVGQSLLVLVGHSIQFSKSEWTSILQFMRMGNEVLFLASEFDPQIEEQFGFKAMGGKPNLPLSKINSGKVNVNALSLNSLAKSRFGIMGRDIKGYFHFTSNDSLKLKIPDVDFTMDKMPEILGMTQQLNKVTNTRDTLLQANFIQYSVGAGHLTMIATPLVFSNYFLLQDKNRPYLDAIWQSVEGDIFQIYWGNFNYRVPNESLFSILWRNKATRWSLIVFLLFACSYLLFQTKRTQRIIPVIPEPVNNSLAFIETVGMLYYNKGDNRNLALKMEQHFLDWVRTKFNLNTQLLDDNFAAHLSAKSGVSSEEVKHLLTLIHQLRLDSFRVSDQMLFELYHQIQQFYKTN